MGTWLKLSTLDSESEMPCRELWISEDDKNKTMRIYDIDVQVSKPLDVAKLKSGIINNFKSRISYIRATRKLAYSSMKLDKVEECPICNSSISAASKKLKIYGALYCRCSFCNHCFVYNRPKGQAEEKFSEKNKKGAVIYTDKKTMMTRVREVSIPKVDWMLKQYKKIYGREPVSVLDVGAGGGHFVYACKKKGINARGVELNQDSRRFCKNNFGLDLECEDFSKKWSKYSDAEVITFWGVIEHVPDPTDLLKAAHKLLMGKKGLVIVEVPRWHSLSTAVQHLFSNTVTRHLDPLGHIHIFTDESLCTAFEKNGFTPVSAWYFGMDIFELFMQLGLSVKNEAVLKNFLKFIPAFQNAIDKGRLSDEMVLAGVPSAKINSLTVEDKEVDKRMSSQEKIKAHSCQKEGLKKRTSLWDMVKKMQPI